MTGKFTVQTCQPTGVPGRYFITYAVKGKPDQGAYHDAPIERGKDVHVLNGKVVMRGVE